MTTRGKSDDEKVRAALEELDASVEMNDEDAAELLKAAGVDAPAALERLKKRVAAWVSDERGKRIDKATQEREDALSRTSAPAPKRTKEESRRRLAELRDEFPQLAAGFKELKEMGEEDLASLVAEFEELAERARKK